MPLTGEGWPLAESSTGPRPIVHLLYRMRGLRTIGTVLHIGTHPDDEDAGLMSWVARKYGARIVYWSATRGEAGQNRIGPSRAHGQTIDTREGMLATMYVSMAQRNPSQFWPTVLLTVNTAPGTRAVVERDVAEALRKADPTVAFTFGTFDQLVEATVTQERLIALVSAFFGGLALLLAAVGLYGVVAHAVRARQTEIGLRIALGAGPASILRLVFERVGVLIAVGLALGLAGSLWAARFVEALLFQRQPRDPVTFGGAATVLIAVGVLAAWLPARRAARLDPVAALREG